MGKNQLSGRGDGLADAEMRAVLRLFMGVTSLPADRSQRQRYLLEGMRKITGSAAAQWLTCHIDRANDRARVLSDLVISRDVQVPAAIEGCLLKRCSLPLCSAAARQIVSLQTSCCHEVVPGSGRYPCCCHPGGACVAGLGDRVCSVMRLPTPGDFRVLKFFRLARDPPLGQRQREIVHTFHEMTLVLGVLFEPAEPRVAAPALPKHLQKVLTHLLSGSSEKEISRATGLSSSTVHSYSKSIYRHFQVSSRGELMARWVSLANDHR